MHDESPAPSLRSPSGVSCPECSAPIAGTYERCPRCALPLRGPVAAELWRLDGALAGLRARETELLARRGHLLGLLGQERAEREGAGQEPSEREGAGQEGRERERDLAGVRGRSAGRPEEVSGSAGRPGTVSGSAGRPGTVSGGRPGVAPEPGKDFSPGAVQNLLLGLGGLLLVVAAVVFTVVSWGSMSLGGRAAILAAVTGLTFAVPGLLVRRGLVTTAETIAMLGAALLFLDGYAARRTGLAGADGLAGPHYAALLFALVALAMAGYSRLLPLRLPLPVAIVLAQFPLPLLALDETAPWITAALAATAAADAAFLVFHMASRSPEPGVGAATTGSTAEGPEKTGPGVEDAPEGPFADKPQGVTDDPAKHGRSGGSGEVSGGREPGNASDERGSKGVPGGRGSGDTSGGREPEEVPGGRGPGNASDERGSKGVSGGRGPLTTVAVCFGVVWGLGVCQGLLESLMKALNPSGAPAIVSLREAPLLVALAVIGLVVARGVRDTDRLLVVTAFSTLTLTAGLAALAWPLMAPTWWAVPYTAAALVTVAIMLYAPGLDEHRVRSAGAVSAGVLAAATALPFTNDVIFTLFAPFNRLGDVWSGSPGFADARLIEPFPQFPIVAGLLAVASALAAARGRAALGFAALAAGTLAAAVAPVAFGWGHAVDLAALSALAVVLVTGMTLSRRSRWAGALAIAAGAVSAVATVTALAERSGTYATLGVLLVAWGAAVFAARVREVAAFSLVAGVLSATGLVWAVSAGTGWLPAGDALALSLAAGAVLAALLALRGGLPATPSSEGPLRSPEGSPRSPEGPQRSPEGSPKGSGDPRRLAGLVLSAVLAVFAVVSAHAAVTAVLGFLRPLVRPWTDVTGPAGGYPLLGAVVGLVAVAAVLVSWQVARRRGAARAVLLAWPALLVALPVSAALPYGVELGLFVAGTVPTAWTAARSRENGLFGGVAALLTASVAISWALMSEPATLVVLPVVAVIAVAVVLGDRARTRVRAGATAGAVPVAFGKRAVAPVAAGLATLLAGGEALAAGLALDWPVRHAAFGLLAVACAAAALAGRSRRSPVAVGVEAAGYVLVGAGLPLASADLPLAGLACAVAGVLMVGTALRPDRRWAGYVGTGFLLLASWLRLLASDVSVIEAYTVPFSLVLLGFGWWRARGGETSSWGAYGPGLASSLVPGMLALLAGSGWLRPLLLGVVSLAVLLIGARFRLQAPAVLGGLTLAVVALHELAPWIAEVVVLVPRWVPMALGGLLLVVVGATYEARLRDVRRLRGAVGRMR
ncbi:SCO7613 C-terminal domain-containing membrane protein [Streptosporangium sp. NPDC002721]|uniref:SCO7613 C-terminal domain-containing membrane protein n=1 Tax=Streptosporangium sp. NPDC002721 TaxID=3366188 RepID=UPI0036A80500